VSTANTASIGSLTSAYTPPTATRLEPVAPPERIQGLDLLRGWAMFGVLWSNLNDWYGTADPTTSFDRGLAFAQEWLVESRFYTLLCFLFGVGFGIQLMRAAERGKSVQRTYIRRSAALLAIGLVHALIVWHGDILTMYALVSFSLLLFRDTSPKRLLLWAIGFYLFAWDVIFRIRWLAGQRFMVPRGGFATSSWIFAHGSLAQIGHERLLAVADWYGRWALTTYFSILAMFLAGVWALRSGYVTRVIKDPGATRRLLGWSIAVALVGYASFFFGAKLWPIRPGAVQPTDWRAALLNPRHLIFHAIDLSTEATALAYAALLLLAFQTKRGARLLAPLAATGRMALTTYLTQSVVSTFLFYSWGLGWFGRVGYTGMFAITLTLFGLQMAASTWWLKRYQFGPVEWVWRTLTYGRAPTMRSTNVAPTLSL
jgi:uncharacterized protein